jgi:hypothetical protein
MVEIRVLPEEVREIVKDILRNPEKYPSEAKFILRLWEIDRNVCHASHWVVEGEVMRMLLHEDRDRGEREYAILPLTVPAILEEEYNCEEKHNYIHVFTAEGWKSVRVY